MNISQNANFYAFPTSQLSSFRGGQLPTTIYYSISNVQTVFYSVGDTSLISQGVSFGVNNPNPTFVQVTASISSFVPPAQSISPITVAIIIVVSIVAALVGGILLIVLIGVILYYYRKKY